MSALRRSWGFGSREMQILPLHAGENLVHLGLQQPCLPAQRRRGEGRIPGFGLLAEQVAHQNLVEREVGQKPGFPGCRPASSSQACSSASHCLRICSSMRYTSKCSLYEPKCKGKYTRQSAEKQEKILQTGEKWRKRLTKSGLQRKISTVIDRDGEKDPGIPAFREPAARCEPVGKSAG